MSIATWKKQYYPTPADRCSKANALDHSIRKWSGATPAALRRHGLTRNDICWIKDNRGSKFVFGWTTCALCVKFGDCSSCYPPNSKTCPIYQVTCDHCFKPLHVWENTGNAKPMLALLRKVKREMAKRDKVKTVKVSKKHLKGPMDNIYGYG